MQRLQAAHRPDEAPGYVFKPEIPRIGDFHGRTLAYLWIDGDGDGSHEHLFTGDLLRFGYACTPSFATPTRVASPTSKMRPERPAPGSRACQAPYE